MQHVYQKTSEHIDVKNYLMPHTERRIKGCFKMLQRKAQVHAMSNMIKEHYTLWQ